MWDHFQTGGFEDDSENRCEIAAMARDRANHLLHRELTKDEVLVIGDTPLDIDCAQSIGARVLAVATGIYKLDELKQHNPTWAVESLEKISSCEACR